MKYIIAFALLFALVVIIIYNVIDSIRIIIRWYFGDYINRYLLIKPIDPLYRAPLRRHMKYYRQLNPENRTIFEKRVQKFINKKTFIPRGGLEHITDEMKALIAGSAIQLTFGHPSIYFTHFKKILVYPDNYYSEISHRYHQGEVNSGGLIVLSWKKFVEGYIDPEDGRNLGLHEMAHALRLENAIANDEYNFLDREVLQSWTDLCYRQMEKTAQGDTGFFRSYAATNSQEFFAVAVENFFEKAPEFHKRYPEIYCILSAMLFQDPLNICADKSNRASK